MLGDFDLRSLDELLSLLGSQGFSILSILLSDVPIDFAGSPPLEVIGGMGCPWLWA